MEIERERRWRDKRKSGDHFGDTMLDIYRNQPLPASIINPNNNNNLPKQPSKEFVMFSSPTDDNKRRAQLCFDRIVKRYEGFKSDLKVFQDCYDHDKTDLQLKQKMKEKMIQEAVEKLLEAMSIFPDDNNSEVVHKLASQIYFDPWTGNKQVIEYREDLLASVKVAKEALTHDPLSTEKLKAGALALILLWDLPTREMIDPLKTVKGLQDAISLLEKALVIDSNDYEAMFYLGKVYYHLSMDTNHLGSAVCLEHCQKASEYFSKVRDEAPTVYKDSAMVEEVENLLATYSSKFERRDTEDFKRAKIMTNSNLGSASIATDENVMLMKFVGVMFDAMSLGVEEKLKAAGEESAKPRLAQELISLYRQVEHMMQDMIMKLSKSP